MLRDNGVLTRHECYGRVLTGEVLEVIDGLMLVRLDIMPVDTDLHTHFEGVRSRSVRRGVCACVLIHEVEARVAPAYVAAGGTVRIIGYYVEVSAYEQVYLLGHRQQGAEVREDSYLRTHAQLAFRLRRIAVVARDELVHVIQRQVPSGVERRVRYLAVQHAVFLRYRERRSDTYGREDAGFPVGFLVLELQRDRNADVMQRLALAPLMHRRGVVVVLLGIRVHQRVAVLVLRPHVVTADMRYRGVVREPYAGTDAPVLVEEIRVLQLQQAAE